MRWIIRGWPGPSADGLGPRLAPNSPHGIPAPPLVRCLEGPRPFLDDDPAGEKLLGAPLLGLDRLAWVEGGRRPEAHKNKCLIHGHVEQNLRKEVRDCENRKTNNEAQLKESSAFEPMCASCQKNHSPSSEFPPTSYSTKPASQLVHSIPSLS